MLPVSSGVIQTRVNVFLKIVRSDLKNLSARCFITVRIYFTIRVDIFCFFRLCGAGEYFKPPTVIDTLAVYV